MSFIAADQFVRLHQYWTIDVNRDRFDYVVAISESVKRQTLLNMVKARCLDMPVYMDIASVISQYALESQLGFEWHLRSN